jgi:predicted aspartyl protease
VKQSFAYDESVDPAAPMLPLRIAAPSEDAPAAVVPALVDTGADCTCIPTATVTALGLPLVEWARIAGVGGTPQRVPVHAALVEIATLRVLTQVIAYGEEAIVGRDVLNRMLLVLDGLRRRISLRREQRRAR